MKLALDAAAALVRLAILFGTIGGGVYVGLRLFNAYPGKQPS